MSEEEATAVESSSEETFINPDGSYKDGWKDALLPEGMRAEKFYDSPFNANVKELLKTAGNQAKMLGKQGVVPINEKSTDFEVQKFREAMGVPDKYDYEKPDLEIFKDKDDTIKAMLEKWNKNNIPQSHVNMVMEDFHNFLKSEEMQTEAAKAAESAEEDRQVLEAESTNYEVNSHYIDNAVRQFTQDWPDDDILALFPSKEHPSTDFKGNKKILMRKFLAGVGKAIGEGKSVTGEATGAGLQQQLDEVMKDPDYLSNTNLKRHAEMVQKASKLFNEIAKQQGRS